MKKFDTVSYKSMLDYAVEKGVEEYQQKLKKMIEEDKEIRSKKEKMFKKEIEDYRKILQKTYGFFMTLVKRCCSEGKPHQIKMYEDCGYCEIYDINIDQTNIPNELLYIKNMEAFREAFRVEFCDVFKVSSINKKDLEITDEGFTIAIKWIEITW